MTSSTLCAAIWAAELRAAGRDDEAATLGAGMWALRKDYRKQTPEQRGTLAQIQTVNKPLYKGYLIKEQIRQAFKAKGQHGIALMRGVIAWGAPLLHRRVHQARHNPVPVQDLDRGHPRRRPLERPRRSRQRPGQRADHPEPAGSAAPPL